MNYLIEYNLFEGVNDNFLYRVIDIEFFMGLAEMKDMPPGMATLSDEMEQAYRNVPLDIKEKYKKYWYSNFLCFSRSKDIAEHIYSFEPCIRLTFDKNKLKQRYKIIPFDWGYFGDKGEGYIRTSKFHEFEERLFFIKHDNLKNWESYLIDIELLNCDGKNEIRYNDELIFIDDVVEKIKEIKYYL